MTKTTTDLATRVLERLQVVAPGDTASDADAKSVTDYYAAIFPEIEDDGMVFWEQATIPDRAFEALSDFIAGRLATDFGLARPDLEQSGMDRLKRMSSIGSTGLNVSGSYF